MYNWLQNPLLGRVTIFNANDTNLVSEDYKLSEGVSMLKSTSTMLSSSSCMNFKPFAISLKILD